MLEQHERELEKVGAVLLSRPPLPLSLTTSILAHRPPSRLPSISPSRVCGELRSKVMRQRARSLTNPGIGEQRGDKRYSKH